MVRLYKEINLYFCVDLAVLDMQEEKNFKINVDNILRAKLGNKYERIPTFVISWLKRRLHQDELNAFLIKEGDKQGVPWLWDCVSFLDMKLEIHGKENLPSPDNDKRYTFVSNHPLGGQDGVALGAFLGEYYHGKVKYLVNDILMSLHGLAPLCVPINKVGTQSRQFPQMVETAFKSDNHIIMFPAGFCSRRRQGVIRDLPWAKAFVSKSVETQRDVVPIHFGGRNSNKFYMLDGISKRLGLKLNISTLYLVDEMFKNRGKTFLVKIGKPIPWRTFDKTRTPKAWAEHVQNIVYNME